MGLPRPVLHEPSPTVRKCSSHPRAQTISQRRRLSLEEVLAGLEANVEAEEEALPPRPKTRGECAGVPRPCPFVSCRMNLYLDVHPETGSLKFNWPDREPDEMQADASCALDVADQVRAGERATVATVELEHAGSLKLEHVGALMNLSVERVRQLSSGALQDALVTLRRAGIASPADAGVVDRIDPRSLLPAPVGSLSEMRERLYQIAPPLPRGAPRHGHAGSRAWATGEATTEGLSSVSSEPATPRR